MQFSLRTFLQFCFVTGLAIGVWLIIFPVANAGFNEETIKSDVLAVEKHGWAGHYSDETRGIDTGPLNVWVSPKGVVFAETHDWWNVKEFGMVVKNNDDLYFEWQRPNRTGRWPTDSNLIPVAFRGNRYLLTMRELHPFCLAAKADGDFPYGILRRLHPKAIEPQFADTTRPIVGAKYRAIVDLPPIELQVTKADKIQRQEYSDDEDKISQSVTVNVGSEDHLFVGMEFSPEDTRRSSPILTITSVQKNHATARWNYFIEKNSSLQAVQVGDRFKTSR